MSSTAASPVSSSPSRHRVVIVGGGFAGLRAALGLRTAPVDVTLIDRRNFHLFQPLLYQVASGGLSPGDIAAPLRTVLKKSKNTEVVLGEVVDIVTAPADGAAGAVVLDDGERVPFDTLLVAAGATHSYFGKDEWSERAPGLKTIEDATEMRARVLTAFEAAELEDDEAARRALLTFVVVGGGPTGVELAGVLGELARQTMRDEFRRIDPRRARILLVEGSPRILSMYAEHLGTYAIRTLQGLGVEVVTSAKVVGIDEQGVDVETARGKQRIPARTVLWAAGVAASPLGKLLQQKLGAPIDRAGRVIVEADCTVPGHPEVLVLGDLASWAHGAVADGEKPAPLPGVAPVAMQMGTYAAKSIRRRLAGEPPQPFRYFDKGTMAVIGRNHAVAHVGFGLGWNLRGFVAWLAWLFIHIMYLVGYENRFLVAVQWAIYYVTRHRGARLIAPPHSRHGLAVAHHPGRTASAPAVPAVAPSPPAPVAATSTTAAAGAAGASGKLTPSRETAGPARR